MTANVSDTERICANCNSSHPSEPYESEFAICLADPEFESFLDDILARQDFSGCRALARRKRFAWDREACEDFDAMQQGIELPDSPELIAELRRLADAGELTGETLQTAILADAFDRIDWSQQPVDDDLRQLREARSLTRRRKILRHLGFLINSENRAAFVGLCRYLRELEPASTLDDTHLRVEILEQLRYSSATGWDRELAEVLVDDLLRTPSNNTTRGWYTAVFRFFERYCESEVAEDAMQRMLDSGQFSYRIRRRIREFLDREGEWDLF